MVFMLPIILLAREEWRGSAGQWTVLLASAFVLAPKNYMFFEQPRGGLAVSWQVVANPLVLLGATVALLAWSLAGEMRANAGAGVTSGAGR